MEVVEHVVELPTFICSCAPLVNTQGITFIATINRNSRPWIFTIVGTEHLPHWLPRGTHQWSKFLEPSELAVALADNDLLVKAESGVPVYYMISAITTNDNIKHKILDTLLSTRWVISHTMSNEYRIPSDSKDVVLYTNQLIMK